VRNRALGGEMLSLNKFERTNDGDRFSFIGKDGLVDIMLH
jgi:hypothetical protein